MPSLAHRPWSALPRALTVTAAPAAPAMRPYAALGLDAGILYCWRYLGGAFVELIGSHDVNGLAMTGSYNGAAVLQTSPLIIAVELGSKLAAWNVDADTVSTPVTTGANFGPLSSGGRAGKAYLIKAPGGDHFSLHSINTAGARVQETTVGQETLAAPLNGVPGVFLIWAGDRGFIAVYGDPGDAGYIEVLANGDQPIFTPSDDWLPGDATTGEWLDWLEGHRIPGANVALVGHSGTPSPLGRVTSSASFTQLAAGADGDIATWDPSPDGVSAVVYSGTTFAHVGIAAPEEPEWAAVEADPVTSLLPLKLFCLD